MTGAFARAGDVIPPRRALACPSRRCRRLGNIPNIRASPSPVSDADTSPVVAEAKDLEKRIHTISGRIAQLDMNLRTCCDDLTAINDSIRRLKRTVADLPANPKARVAAEQSLYQALVMKGAGPAGALDGYLKPPRNGKFMHLFLGGAVDVTSQRQSNRLQGEGGILLLQGQIHVTYLAWPIFLLYLNGERQRRVVAGQGAFAGISLVTIFPVLVQFYWCWMLYFYAALALRENVLRANGSTIRKWWINHHYYSMGMCLVVLTMDVQSHACLNYMSRFLVFTALQGAVMLVQNRYQRFRMYTRVAMGKASPMDVAGGEMSGNAGQLKLLYPLLFGLQALQVYFGASVLVAVAQEHGVLSDGDHARVGLLRARDSARPSSTRGRIGTFSASGRRPPRGRCSASWGRGTSGRRFRRTS